METKYTLIENVNLITAIDSKDNIYWNDDLINEKNISVLIENDKIAEISSKISKSGIDKVIDGNDKLLMPSLINTHTHSPMNLFRGLADDLELDTWLNEYVWPVESGLNGDLCYLGAQIAIMEMIKSGTTCFSDMYFFMDYVAKAVEDGGLRAVLSNGMIDFSDEEKRKNEFKESENLIKKWNNKSDGRIKVFFGPHSPITASKELLTGVREKANKYDVGINIHMNETQKEIENILNQYNMRPFEYLNEIGFLDGDVLAAHCVWLSDNEIDIIKEKDIKVSYNPGSNMKLASGIAPISDLIEKNICVSLGSDGVASNNNLDLFEEMKLASLLQKVDTLNPKSLTAEQTIKMATINGARALGLENEIGSIEIGKKADMILVNTNSIAMSPSVNSLISHLVYSANGSTVDTTICNGDILMENKNLNVFNEEESLKNLNLATSKLKKVLN
ncbi:amidohydrolase family protein [Methanobrevibacter curvatus]|uniref:5'-deoxyadenosine deaminase n=1 Tax=Methanobrevibacter curvatus TaxID=49547 RepID=A0A166CEK2_9EURY|nr:amidohydrolase family protein [Methanobrevibacter curvatus]KZX14424.1 5-methylthioadenosine/S-adenosylhomocysteine deaminase [Methanobrevibacter curvatus]